MILNTLKLQQFKNYKQVELEFGKGINCIIGKNGMGKTNLLDAVHFLSMTRSAFGGTDLQNIKHGQAFFALNAVFEGLEVASKVNVYYEKGAKKIIKVDGQEPEKLSDHIGTIPSVLTAPDDSEIIKEGSEIRRKLFDGVISQFNKDYLGDLIKYQRILKQRNSFLKQNEGRMKINRSLLETYDSQLIPLNSSIAVVREAFIQDFQSSFQRNYEMIFPGEEHPLVAYNTNCLDSDFQRIYQDSFEKDLILQRTNVGVHKDDYKFILNDRPIKRFGSQGQQKSFILALKLAEYDYLMEKKGFAPLLLLDDIFDKLDDERIAHLVTLLSDRQRFPQIFITDARVERAKTFFEEFDDVSYYEVSEGQVL
ncbi:DNA replication/repair protein RecF [Marinoscillum sp. MHG1-6]|uniref:DNA replication/repair protein RecF n=1 Tax=Marinoscillum sp. MHG1-6 TaxID=2959627 RepID=UPI002157DAE9|nr:DNA replication/repair protein RecF [Marinoscillum sp. MHG1-6]